MLGLREDGYHELRTLFQTIDLHDDIVLRPRPRGVTVRCDHPLVPTDGTNLAARAAEALRRYGRVSGGVEIEIRKRIPVGGGLGGGVEQRRRRPPRPRPDVDAGPGAGRPPRPGRAGWGPTCPIFLLGGTALGLSRGDEVYPLRRQIRAHVVVVDPGIHVSTARVFARRGRAIDTPFEQ